LLCAEHVQSACTEAARKQRGRERGREREGQWEGESAVTGLNPKP
jgi:hypothetical protein